jgi:hypothetical protein
MDIAREREKESQPNGMPNGEKISHNCMYRFSLLDSASHLVAPCYLRWQAAVERVI